MDERVAFKLVDAERIARAVRKSEAGDRDEAPLSFRRVSDAPAARIDVYACSWTGAWGLNQTHEITLQTAGTPTAIAINTYFGFKPAISANGQGLVVRGRGVNVGSWVLSCFSLDRVDNYLEILPSNETVQFLGHGGTDVEEQDGHTGPFLKWFSVTTCEASG